jgi:hypothetical protein
MSWAAEYLDDLDGPPGTTAIPCPGCLGAGLDECRECWGDGTVWVPALDVGE